MHAGALDLLILPVEVKISHGLNLAACGYGVVSCESDAWQVEVMQD